MEPFVLSGHTWDPGMVEIMDGFDGLEDILQLATEFVEQGDSATSVSTVAAARAAGSNHRYSTTTATDSALSPTVEQGSGSACLNPRSAAEELSSRQTSAQNVFHHSTPELCSAMTAPREDESRTTFKMSQLANSLGKINSKPKRHGLTMFDTVETGGIWNTFAQRRDSLLVPQAQPRPQSLDSLSGPSAQASLNVPLPLSADLPATLRPMSGTIQLPTLPAPGGVFAGCPSPFSIPDPFLSGAATGANGAGMHGTAPAAKKRGRKKQPDPKVVLAEKEGELMRLLGENQLLKEQNRLLEVVISARNEHLTLLHQAASFPEMQPEDMVGYRPSVTTEGLSIDAKMVQFCRKRPAEAIREGYRRHLSNISAGLLSSTRDGPEGQQKLQRMMESFHNITKCLFLTNQDVMQLFNGPLDPTCSVARDDNHWLSVVQSLALTQQQINDIIIIHQLYTRWSNKVEEERRTITKQLCSVMLQPTPHRPPSVCLDNLSLSEHSSSGFILPRTAGAAGVMLADMPSRLGSGPVPSSAFGIGGSTHRTDGMLSSGNPALTMLVDEHTLLEQLNKSLMRERCLYVLMMDVFFMRLLAPEQGARMIIQSYPYVPDISCIIDVLARYYQYCLLPSQMSQMPQLQPQPELARQQEQQARQQLQQLVQAQQARAPQLMQQQPQRQLLQSVFDARAAGTVTTESVHQGLPSLLTCGDGCGRGSGALAADLLWGQDVAVCGSSVRSSSSISNMPSSLMNSLAHNSRGRAADICATDVGPSLFRQQQIAQYPYPTMPMGWTRAL